jgi:hypothetical protein
MLYNLSNSRNPDFVMHVLGKHFPSTANDQLLSYQNLIYTVHFVQFFTTEIKFCTPIQTLQSLLY